MRQHIQHCNEILVLTVSERTIITLAGGLHQKDYPHVYPFFAHFSDLSMYYRSAQDYSSHKKNGQIRAIAFAKTTKHLSMV
jgi:hypothetical protein